MAAILRGQVCFRRPDAGRGDRSAITAHRPNPFRWTEAFNRSKWEGPGTEADVWIDDDVAEGEKARRRELLNASREDNRRAFRDQLPVRAPVLRRLFDHLDDRLSAAECDDTLRFTREFIAENGLSEEPIVFWWLEKNGGYCDCEALNNAEQVVEDAIPGYRDVSPT